MDQIKIGKFIQSQRKNKNITQSEMAEMLNVSDRAVSKWERGICLPDASNMIRLCEILDISINDLFNGEIVDMKNNEESLEKIVLEVVRQKEEKDRQLLNLELVIGFICLITFFTLLFVSLFIQMPLLIRILLISTGIILFFTGMFFALRIEQTAGFYECMICHHKYIPTYSSVFFAMHINRTRYMKCPKCCKRSWNKKIISGEKSV